MSKSIYITIGVFLTFTVLTAFLAVKRKETVIYLIGDSTVADYALEEGYMEKRYPLVGWGQLLQPLLVEDSLLQLKHLIGNAQQVRVDDRAKGGRSTRTFFQEGRWRSIVENLKPGDIVMIQFGHNDGSVAHPERYVDTTGYKEFLRLFISQTRQKKGLPILLTPVARNYPWKEGMLHNVHGDYPDAVKKIAAEMSVPLIDLNEISMNFFNSKGKEYVTKNYFMNFPPGQFAAYPQGQTDNTHFQVEGGKEVARLVFSAMKKLRL
ncbi:rhamnogalacturonan acetylesterase [Sphingobacterium pedocola]|uniref:GDSL family lipase n=1 Tax=Sphingobacterium pedocola TaxID=2082722 RepID=A0ABR9TCN3_9SPHI|nr:rhamnogalacturonan acetylesterase [Sphingobacterium pedocola]MBE8723051.1 GDSL family lipase [Sphingobacterium pedocola]